MNQQQSEAKPGLRIELEEPERVLVYRETRESIAEVHVDAGPRHECVVNTGLSFFDHMLEQICWHGCINIDAQFTHKRYRLTHVITEDLGLTLGYGLGRLVKERTVSGINAAGAGTMGIDEAIAMALISFEGRSNTYYTLQTPGARLERVEDMLTADLVAFFDGLAQGARCTIHLRSLEGIDPHHVWESIFRAFGVALRNALAPNAWRAGMTAGLKGILE